MPQTLTNGVVVPINSDAYNLSTDLATMGGSVKQYLNDAYKNVAGTSSGSLPVVSGWINLGPDINVPANLFGVGIPFLIEVDAQAITTNGAGGTTAIRVQFNAAAGNGGQGQTAATAQTSLPVHGSFQNDSATAITVRTQISALNAAATIGVGPTISFTTVKCSPYTGF